VEVAPQPSSPELSTMQKTRRSRILAVGKSSDNKSNVFTLSAAISRMAALQTQKLSPSCEESTQTPVAGRSRHSTSQQPKSTYAFVVLRALNITPTERWQLQKKTCLYFAVNFHCWLQKRDRSLLPLIV